MLKGLPDQFTALEAQLRQFMRWVEDYNAVARAPEEPNHIHNPPSIDSPTAHAWIRAAESIGFGRKEAILHYWAEHGCPGCNKGFTAYLLSSIQRSARTAGPDEVQELITVARDWARCSVLRRLEGPMDEQEGGG